MYYGFTTREVRALSYDYAVKIGLGEKIPKLCKDTKMAGVDWINGSLRRQSKLSVRKPQATSLARATAFNRVNVATFFGKLETL